VTLYLRLTPKTLAKTDSWTHAGRIARGLAILLGCALALSCTAPNDAYCTSNSDCSGHVDRPICDPDLNACVVGDAGVPPQCDEDSDCTTEPNRPQCVDQFCVPCEVSSDCSVSAPVCEMPGLPCTGCSGDGDCSTLYPQTPHCETGSGACVGCRDDLDCTEAGKPICGNDLICHPCISDADCDSTVCDEPNGACIDADDVIYVDVEAASGDCSQKDPCPTIMEGVAILSGSKVWMKIAPGIYPERVVIDGPTAILIAAGVELAPTTAGPALTIRGTANVTVEGMTVRGATGAGSTGDGVRCELGDTDSPTCRLVGIQVLECRGQGIEANTASLSVERSLIQSNVSGGIAITGSDFSIVNSVIAQNGGASAGGGVIVFGNPLSGNADFQFNTVTENVGPTGQAATGLLCLGVTVPIGFKNSIVFGNQTTGTGTQVSGDNCTWTYSNIGPQTPGGTTNISAPPQFAAIGDYHLGASSPCIDQAEPDNVQTDDIDGRNTRPTGDGLDIGADERP
jgi:hypothetical protein